MTAPDHRRPWSPLLEGPAAAAAEAVVAEILAALDELLEGSGRTTHAGYVLGSASFASGLASPLLLALQLAHARRPDRSPERAEQLLERLLHRTAETSLGPTLYEGLAGVAWVTVYAARLLGETDAEELVADVDQALADSLAVHEPPWPDGFDLLRGSAGLGLSALQRIASPAARRTVELAVAHLDAAAERDGPSGSGVTWRSTSPANPTGFYNLGMAHGQAGVIGFLGRALGAATRGEIAPATGERAGTLLDEAVGWLLAQRFDAGDEASAFPSAIVPGLPDSPAPLAWCYGDLGIVFALLAAAEHAERPDWRDEALAVATRAARRDPEQAGVEDTCLCHGTAGLGHQFHRLHRMTGDPLFADTARTWFTRTLAMRRPGEGVAGFPTWTTHGGEVVWRADAGLLLGAAGVALCLAAALDPVEPDWDEVMLLSG